MAYYALSKTSCPQSMLVNEVNVGSLGLLHSSKYLRVWESQCQIRINYQKLVFNQVEIFH